jgi:acetyltransferase-like isoleucine patch superfamily enzyme
MTVKRALHLACVALTFPAAALTRAVDLPGGQHRAFRGFSQLLSLVPGTLGDMLRRGFYVQTLTRCSWQASFDFGVLFSTPEAEIGDHVYIGPHSIVSKAVIGDDTIIGSFVSVTSGRATHHFADAATPIRLQGGSRGGVRIGRDCWIGNQAVVMADVGDGCVVGAGSVVVQEARPGHVVAGNPARTIKERTESGARPAPARSA